MGGKVGAEWIHACGWLSPFAMDLKLSQHCNQLYSDIKLKVKKKKGGNKTLKTHNVITSDDILLKITYAFK